jgi:hypothetical protein
MSDGPFDPSDAESAAEDQWVALLDDAAQASRRVTVAALRLLAAELEEQEHAHSADEAQYAQELLALAARELTRAVDALPRSQQPVGWHDTTDGA